MSFTELFETLLDFTFYYPLFMSYVWMSGAIYYFFYREKSDHRRPDDPPPLDDAPPVTFIVPCHNEGETVTETLYSLCEQDYPGVRDHRRQ